MDLFKTLKQFKNIEPDSGFTERSRREILSVGQRRGFNPLGAVWKSLEFAVSLSLAGILIFVILGGISNLGIFTSSPLNALDTQKIKAEADAIDINIELADLLYKESESGKRVTAQAESTRPEATISETKEPAGENEQIISIDEALLLLSQ